MCMAARVSSGGVRYARIGAGAQLRRAVDWFARRARGTTRVLIGRTCKWQVLENRIVPANKFLVHDLPSPADQC